MVSIFNSAGSSCPWSLGPPEGARCASLCLPKAVGCAWERVPPVPGILGKQAARAHSHSRNQNHSPVMHASSKPFPIDACIIGAASFTCDAYIMCSNEERTLHNQRMPAIGANLNPAKAACIPIDNSWSAVDWAHHLVRSVDEAFEVGLQASAAAYMRNSYNSNSAPATVRPVCQQQCTSNSASHACSGAPCPKSSSRTFRNQHCLDVHKKIQAWCLCCGTWRIATFFIHMQPY